MAASAPKAIAGRRYERTVAMSNISDKDFYILDIFRVTGGTDHAKFFHSYFGTVTARGLKLEPAETGFGSERLMRSFQVDRQPTPGWSVELVRS